MIPSLLFIVITGMKYPYEIDGDDKKIAINDWLSDIGLDLYYVGLTILISITVALFKNNIPIFDVLILVIYTVLSAVPSFLYRIHSDDLKNNYCFWAGLIIGLAGICFGIFSCVTYL
ncbi:hypothetical protein FJY84_08910 [Candidatus Bathyarchaeota archaeon]|nr:hypothetical protein [Candidatus Bathyarchaeota archaeon]